MKRSEFVGLLSALFAAPLIKNDDKIKINSNSNADYMSFMSKGNEKLRIGSDGKFVINSSGNLGMGTPTPDCIATLDIKGSVISSKNILKKK